MKCAKCDADAVSVCTGANGERAFSCSSHVDDVVPNLVHCRPLGGHDVLRAHYRTWKMAELAEQAKREGRAVVITVEGAAFTECTCERIAKCPVHGYPSVKD